ncbi:hypothetical protein HAX54_002365 [Datura stramonium]|uniref:Uncharacterized protein n=1 Tax=Datura stramonium TaxID=4076 RepID=A0ABS8T4P1_DATST|nr:hypothetical protein [Datura stramonium]
MKKEKINVYVQVYYMWYLYGSTDVIIQFVYLIDVSFCGVEYVLLEYYSLENLSVISQVQWGKKILMVGGKTDPASDKVSVWAFDTETECWSLLEAKGDVPVARSGHTVLRASSVLILFGGEDAKRRKLNDLHMFDLKSLTWLPLHCTGTGPSPRSNHVSALYDDKLLLIFGGSSKSRTLNDLYTLDFETMAWSRIKIRGFHPSPRAGCCGVLCGTKWYIAGGGSRKRRHAETLIFDVLKLEWSVAVASPASSITTNKIPARSDFPATVSVFQIPSRSDFSSDCF